MKSSLPPFWEHFKKLHEASEKNVSSINGAYKDLSSEALYTSGEDLLKIFRHPLVNGSFVDLGCGNGQSVLLYAHEFPERSAVGIEFQFSRLEVGQNVLKEYSLRNASLVCDDLLKVNIPKGDTYFLYFPTGPVLDRILSELYKSGRSFTLVAIESHGHLLPRLDLENWLTLKDEIHLHSPRHYHAARIYETNGSKRSSQLEPFEHTFREHFLLINDWIGETYGMEWESGERFELMTPPRTIQWKDVKKLMTLAEIPEKYHVALKLRRLGKLEFRTTDNVFHGHLRKIIVEPSFVVEISSGEKIEWKDIKSIFQGSKLCYEASSQS